MKKSNICEYIIVFFYVSFQINFHYRKEVKKRKWSCDINLSREIKGEFYTLFADLQKDEKRFYQYFRMTEPSFTEILGYIEQDIRKNDTNFRCAIPAVERLAITLR